MVEVKISVIIPTFNSQKFIGYALMSIKDFVDEIIIMDMSSTDRTAEVIEATRSRKVKFLYLKDYIKDKKQLNLDSSIEQGLKFATGNVVMRMDDDWIWGPETSELRDYCIEGFDHAKRGLTCFVYNLITTNSYFLPTWRRPTFMFRTEKDTLRTFGSYKTDDNVICHENETKGGEALFRRSQYLRTPFRLGHWKFLKDTQRRFIEKWIMFRGGTEEDALKKWHYYQGLPTCECPEDLKFIIYRHQNRFVPLGGFDMSEAIEKENQRKLRFEQVAKARELKQQ